MMFVDLIQYIVMDVTTTYANTTRTWQGGFVACDLYLVPKRRMTSLDGRDQGSQSVYAVRQRFYIVTIT